MGTVISNSWPMILQRSNALPNAVEKLQTFLNFYPHKPSLGEEFPNFDANMLQTVAGKDT
jgi:hypothetical protein